MTNNEAIGILAIVVETAKGRCFVTDEAISDAYAMAISALQAQDSPKPIAESAQNVPKEDLISRKAAIEAECEVCQIAPKKERGHNCTYYVHGCKEIECLRALPSAQPERKKGKWIDGRCSICGCDIPAYIIDWKWQKDMDANYCPVCGADMREDQHDQSK